MKKDSCLEDLKKEYKKLQKRYSLPYFEELNQDFYIEKISEIETEYLIREIRKFIADKVGHYSNLVEAILHPANSTMFVFSFIKSMTKEDKNKFWEVYKRLGKLRLEIIKLDINFSEEEEANFVNKAFNEWQELKKVFSEVIEDIDKNWETKIEFNGSNYFG